MIICSNQWEDIIIINVYSVNNIALKYTKQKLTELRRNKQIHNHS